MESIVNELRELYEWYKDETEKNKPPEIERKHCLLCVDVGHTRCKAALLQIKSQGNNIASFQLELCETTESEGFFKEDKFYEFVSWLSKQTNEKKLDGLAIALSCLVENNVPKNLGKWKWPQNLEEMLHHHLETDKILFLNDAVAFAQGCLYEKISFSKSQYPILCLTLGTGIGCAVITKENNKIYPFEVGNISKKWPSGFDGTPHQFAGESFFAWVKRDTNYSPEKIKKVYSQHIGWIIDSLKEQLEFRSIILGGGRSSYIDKNQLLEIVGKKQKIHIVQGFETSLVGVGYAWINYYI